MKRNNVATIAIVAFFFLFLVLSWVLGFDPGKQIGYNFAFFSLDMLKVVPCVFILIGLFETWVKQEMVEKQFGEKSGVKGYLWAMLLASTTVGGLYVAFPVGYSLYSKGAKLSVVFTYVGASAICRVPMTIFEASFLGIKFTAIRLLVAIPLVVASSMLLGSYLGKANYRIVGGE